MRIYEGNMFKSAKSTESFIVRFVDCNSDNDSYSFIGLHIHCMKILSSILMQLSCIMIHCCFLPDAVINRCSQSHQPTIENPYDLISIDI